MLDSFPLSLTHVRLVVASPPHVYKLSCFDERALSSFSCGIQTFRSPSLCAPPSGLLRTLLSRLAGLPSSSSTYHGSKTREVQLSDSIESLEVLKEAHTGKETEMSEFHRRTSLELVHRNRKAYIHGEARPQRGVHESEIREMSPTCG